jgi:hypothetical protein
MTRISSLFVATTLAILPISAFAQSTVAPAKTVAPATTTTVAPATIAPVAGKTAATATTNVTQPAKPDTKTPATATKTQVHGMNSVNTHHAKISVPAKTAEPTKS